MNAGAHTNEPADGSRFLPGSAHDARELGDDDKLNDTSAADARRPRPSAQPPAVALTVLRDRAGLTQVDLAERAGVALSTLRRLENYPGTCQTKWSTLRKIADVLGAEPHELLASAPDASRILAAERAAAAADNATAAAPEVLQIADVARLLRTTTKRLRKILETRPDDLPRPLPQIDRAYRWSRVIVDRWLAGDPSAAGGRRRGR